VELITAEEEWCQVWWRERKTRSFSRLVVRSFLFLKAENDFLNSREDVLRDLRKDKKAKRKKEKNQM